MRPPRIIYPANGACFGEEKIIFGPGGCLNWRGALIRAFTVPRGILVITMERCCGQYSVTNCRNVGAMLGCQCDVSAFDLRGSMCRPSKIDVSTFDDRCVDLRPAKMDDRCADLRRSLVVASTFEDR